MIARNVNVHAMAQVTGIATGQLILKRNTMRPMRKKGKAENGREVTIRGIYDWWTPRECM